jgi:hypothetical protein
VGTILSYPHRDERNNHDYCDAQLAFTGSSQNKDLIVNADGSVDVYFGPKPPAGKEPNWVQTVPGQTWFTILRLYGPLEPWFNKTWQPGEIELQA